MKKTIDAKNKKLGRLATEVAVILSGKNSPSFQKNKVSEVRVSVINASQLDIGFQKLKEKEYKRFSGYPGGLKTESMEKVIEKKGHKEVIKRAVYGMLPKNKLRSEMIKNLEIIE